jgi:hypothetical protein
MYRKLLIPLAILFFIVSSGCTTPQPTPPATGSLAISSNPPGSEIYLDGVYRGTTPSTVPDVTEGSHTLELRYREYSSWSTSIEISGGTKLAINATLTPIFTPTMIPTTVPTPTPTPEPDPLLGCWEMAVDKGDGGAYILELQSGGLGRLSAISSTGSKSIAIDWYQDPGSTTIYVSGINPWSSNELMELEFEYHKNADYLTTPDFPIPFERVPC